MSFISTLFGGGRQATPTQIAPRMTPPTPRIGDAAGESAVRARRDRLQGLEGDQTILTGLGSVGTQTGNIQRSTLLGSAANAA